MVEFEILKERSEAVDYLAKSLRKGQLVLFIGAGISKGFGLPDWIKLINLIRTKVGQSPLPKNADVDSLQRAGNEIEIALNSDQERLTQLISEHLYPPSKLSAAQSVSNPLLVAISALLMGSKRGHVTRVITLNYDNMLEWFLELFGFEVKTISDLPELEGSEDVRIYHPNGFVPNPKTGGRNSKHLILSRTSVNDRNGATYDSWKELARHIMLSGLCLFIGLSHNSLIDRGNEALFTYCARILCDERPVGFWISYDAIRPEWNSDFDVNKIVPLHISSGSEICEFILEICQKARKNSH